MKHLQNHSQSHILLTIMLLLLTSANASAQWWVNGGGDLETSLLLSGTPYANVTVNNHLAVYVNSTTCPASTFGGGTLDYPFVVNNLPTTASPADGTAIVLWDTTGDHIRKIIGLSPAAGIAMFAGNDDQSGAGIRLNSEGATVFPKGSVQTISYGNTGAGARAYEHLNWNTASMDNLFSLDQNGDARITGKLSFALLGGDIAYRNIEGLSTGYGINMYTGTAASPGTSMQMDALNGVMRFNDLNTLGLGIPPPIAFDFTYPNAATHLMQIYKNANTRIGNYGTPTATERLTVDGDIYINSTDNNDATYRNIYAKSALGALNITSGSNTDGSDGACQTAIAWNNTTTNTPGPGLDVPTPGAYIVKSFGDASTGVRNGSPLAYAFQNWMPTTSSIHNIFLINHFGQGIFGPDIQLNYIAGNDVFTVNNTLGFWSPNDEDYRSIHGNTYHGELVLSSQRGSTDGAWVEICGAIHPTVPGEIRLGSNGTSGFSTLFMNYDGSGYHYNAFITKMGLMAIGQDLVPASLVSGDVLTVQDQIGFHSSTGARDGDINGNTIFHALALHANTSTTNSASIELKGVEDVDGSDTRGQITYVSAGPNDHVGHDFLWWNGTAWNHYMRIYNNGAVTIGDPDLAHPNIGSSTNPNGYRLYVQYGILTEQVRVALNGSLEWTDYVFKKDYDLMPLNKVEAYVKKNSHLPDVPSAEDVKKEGIDVATMDAKLLQKIEELTLYVIQQEKRIDELQKKVDKQIK